MKTLFAFAFSFVSIVACGTTSTSNAPDAGCGPDLQTATDACFVCVRTNFSADFAACNGDCDCRATFADCGSSSTTVFFDDAAVPVHAHCDLVVAQTLTGPAYNDFVNLQNDIVGDGFHPAPCYAACTWIGTQPGASDASSD